MAKIVRYFVIFGGIFAKLDNLHGWRSRKCKKQLTFGQAKLSLPLKSQANATNSVDHDPNFTTFDGRVNNESDRPLKEFRLLSS